MLRRGSSFLKKKRERGVVLVAALLVLILLTTLVLEHAYAVRVEGALAQGGRDQLRARLAARSAVQLARTALETDFDEDATSFHEPWARPVPPIPLSDGVDVSFTIEDEAGRYNINYFTSEGTLRSVADKERFERLLVGLELPRRISDLYTDWADADDLAFPLGAEGEYAFEEEPFRAPNHPLTVVEELRYLYEVPSEEIEAFLPFVTIYSEGTVNVNTAPRAVLESLDAELTPHRVDRILSERERSPFDSSNDFRDRVDLGDLVMERIGSVITVESKIFRVKVRARAGEAVANVEAVIQTGSNNVLYWREW